MVESSTGRSASATVSLAFNEFRANCLFLIFQEATFRSCNFQMTSPLQRCRIEVQHL